MIKYRKENEKGSEYRRQPWLQQLKDEIRRQLSYLSKLRSLLIGHFFYRYFVVSRKISRIISIIYKYCFFFIDWVIDWFKDFRWMGKLWLLNIAQIGQSVAALMLTFFLIGCSQENVELFLVGCNFTLISFVS